MASAVLDVSCSKLVCKPRSQVPRERCTLHHESLMIVGRAPLRLRRRRRPPRPGRSARAVSRVRAVGEVALDARGLSVHCHRRRRRL